MLTKHCKTCDTTKPVAGFYKDIRNSTGYTARCMPCSREYSRLQSQSSHGKLAKKNSYRRQRIKYIDKHRACRRLVSAVREGRVIKPNKCSGCGISLPARKIHGHHPDYSKPLDVVWVCTICHKALHNKLVDPVLISKAVTERIR